jgi:hypothetical protein
VHDVISIAEFKSKDVIHDCLDDLTFTIEALEAANDGYITLTQIEAIDTIRIVRSRLLRLIGEKG